MVRLIHLFTVFCLVQASVASAAEWTDATGRRVNLPDSPRRIVSLVPCVTEVLFAMGLEERLVGVTEFCTYPPEALAKPRVGGYSTPSLEGVMVRQPDLVLASADSVSPSFIRRLERLGIAVYVVNPRSLAGTLEMIRDIGKVTGESLPAEELAQRLQESIDEIKAMVAGRPKVKVLPCVMVRPLTVAGPLTIVGELIAAAGGVTVVPEGALRYPVWGLEAVLAVDPDLILICKHPGQPDPGVVFSVLPELRAVRNSRVLSVEADWIHRPGPRLALGLSALLEALHGIDMQDEELAWTK